MASPIATLSVDLVANAGQLYRELGKANKQTESWGKKFKKASGEGSAGLATIAKGSAAAAASIAAMGAATVALVRHSAQQAQQVENMARLANMASGEFQAYAYATAQVGISSEKLADISKDVQDKLGDFIATGGGGFKDFFEQVAPKVGLTADALRGLSGPDVLVAVKAAMDEANVSAEEQVFYLEAIASDAALLTPLLKDNGAAMREQASEAHRLGLVLSEVESQKLLDAAQASDKFDAALGGLTDHLAAQFAPAVSEGMELATEAFARLSESLASGELVAYIDAIGGKFESLGGDIAGMLDDVSGLWRSFLGTEEGGGIANATGETVDFMIDAFANMPENIRAFIQTMTVELLAFIDKTGAYGQEMLDNLQFWQDETFDLDGQLARINAVRADSIQSIMNERQLAIASFDAQITGAKSLREEYAAAQSERAQAVAAGALPAMGGPIASPADKKTAAKAADQAAREAERRAAEFESIRQSLLSQEEALAESYLKRREIILANTEATERQRQQLMERLEVQTADQLEQIRAAEAEKTDLMTTTAQTVEGAFSNAFMSIDQGLDNMVANFARAMAQMVAQQSASQLASGITGALGIGAAAAGGGGGAAGMGAMFAGLFDAGGTIGSGQFGIVGERGPEIVHGPATVTGRKDTAALLSSANQQPAQPANVQVVNQLDPTVFNQWAASPDFERTIVNCLRNNSSELRGYITG